MNHESMGLKSCVRMGATHETCSDVLIHSHNHKVNRACAKSTRRPGMVCNSVRVALNSHPQLQWARSPSHITERETLLVSPGDQLALTFRLCLECPKEGFWNPLVNQREEVGIQTSSEKRGKRSEFGLLYPGLLGYGIGKRWNEWPAWPFVPSTSHSSGWKWNGEMWNKSEGHFSVFPIPLCLKKMI